VVHAAVYRVLVDGLGQYVVLQAVEGLLASKVSRNLQRRCRTAKAEVAEGHVRKVEAEAATHEVEFFSCRFIHVD